LAADFVAWLHVPAGAHWLDVGCGTGALSAAVCRHGSPASVLGCDRAEPFVEYARANCRDARATFTVAGVGSLPGRAAGYGSVSSLLALNFFPDPLAAVREMCSLAAPGGFVSACAWDYAGGIEFLRFFWEAAVALDPTASALDERGRFPTCHLDALTDLFRAGRLSDVHGAAIEIETVFAGFDDYWRPLLGGTGPAPSYVESLAAARRTALAQELERSLPRRADGSIALTARALAVQGIATKT
jgi:SAM-dependent methyltransferase